MVFFYFILSVFLSVQANGGANIKREDSLRRVKMGELFLNDDREGFLASCDELIAYHKSNGNEKYLFDAYATKFDRLQMWGMYDMALDLLNQMSEEAQARNSKIGAAITSFCFGQFYLTNFNSQEAERHYLQAFEQLCLLGERGRALRAGFNLQAIQMNLDSLEKGLKWNDSTAVLLDRLEAINGTISPNNRLKQARYRFVLMQRLGRMKEASELKDTMLYYVEICKDPGLNETVQASIAQFEQLSGQKALAYARLEKMIEGYAKDSNYLKMAQFRKSLADFQADNGDLALAVDNYRLYAIERDSARVIQNLSQLNALTKKYELNELKLENKMARRRLRAAGLLIALLTALILVIAFYAWVVRRKNVALYEASNALIRSEDIKEQSIIEDEGEPFSAEAKLYASLLSLVLEKNVLKDPLVNRDKLSQSLGTNRTYLASAVKKCSGKTLGDFILEHRLRYAAKMLVSELDVPVVSVGEESGFSSRSTFYRNFIEHFGMSPSEYRAISQRKH